MRSTAIAISAALLWGGVSAAGAMPALPKASPVAEQAAITQVHQRCYTTLVKRHHRWVRVTRCRW